jgi:hypothetical protein
VESTQTGQSYYFSGINSCSGVDIGNSSTLRSTTIITRACCEKGKVVCGPSDKQVCCDACNADNTGCCESSKVCGNKCCENGKVCGDKEQGICCDTKTPVVCGEQCCKNGCDRTGFYCCEKKCELNGESWCCGETNSCGNEVGKCCEVFDGSEKCCKDGLKPYEDYGCCANDPIESEKAEENGEYMVGEDYCCPSSAPIMSLSFQYCDSGVCDYGRSCYPGPTEVISCTACADTIQECLGKAHEVEYGYCEYGFGELRYWGRPDADGDGWEEDCDIGYQRKCKEPKKCTYEPQDGETFSLNLCLKKGTIEADTCGDQSICAGYTWSGWTCSGTTCSRECNVKEYDYCGEGEE